MTKFFFSYLFGIFSLFLGYVLMEDATGGAKHDHNVVFKHSLNFQNNFYNTFGNFLNGIGGGTDHSPVFYIISGQLINLFGSIFIFKLIYILISCFIPFLFYLILKEKFKFNKTILFYFSLIIFFSPYFRAAAIWSLGDNLAIIFFELFILYLLKAKSNVNFIRFFFYSLIFLVISCYIRPIFCFFWFYYVFVVLKKTNFNSSVFIIILSFFLAMPALVYLWKIIFLNNQIHSMSNFLNLNYISIFFQSFSILFFYLIPFIYLNINLFIKYINVNSHLIFFTILIIFITVISDIYLDLSLIRYGDIGGGVFRKIAEYLKINNYIMLIFSSFLGIVSTLYIINKKDVYSNFLVLICLVLSFPLTNTFQKYFDPMYLFIYFGLINSKTIHEWFENDKLNLKFIYLYFFSFYIFSFIYYNYIKIS